MKVKIFTLILCGFFALTLNAETFKLDLSAPGFGGTAGADYNTWHYFSFETGEIVTTTEFTLENLAGGIGDEVPDAGMAARTDWDIAFHAYDIRTNSGTSANGSVGALMIADTDNSSTPLSEVYESLTKAPVNGYEADKVIDGMFYKSLSSMPPPRATQLSVCEAANGWAALGMSGNVENPKVLIFKTANGKYVKVHLKQFFGDGTEGNPEVGAFVMDYEFIPLEGGSALNENAEVKFNIYPNPAAEVLNVELPEAAGNSAIVVYNMTGAVVKQVVAQAGVNRIQISDLAPGTYFLKVNNQVEKFIVK